MTTDKPATGWAIDAAKELLPAAYTTDFRSENATVIQAAIDEATAAVVAERDKANKDADTACEWKSRLTTQRDEARAAARELFAELAYANAHTPRQQGGHTRREKLLTKHAALKRAEPKP